MSIEHFPGTIVTLLDRDFKAAGEVEIECYIRNEKAYKVWWTYTLTGESELIKVPEWRLTKKAAAVTRVIR